MSLTGTFGATKATELASLFTAADLRVSTEIDLGGISPDIETNLSNEGPAVGGFNI